jgi:hypothetical protein
MKRQQYGKEQRAWFFFSLHIVFIFDREQKHRIWDASARRFDMTFGLIAWHIATSREIV